MSMLQSAPSLRRAPRELDATGLEADAPPLRILFADDHVLVRKGLSCLLAELGPEVEVLEAGTLAEALEVGDKLDLPLDLILLDLYMPGTSGLDALQLMRARRPETPVVLISGFDDPEQVLAALDAGAAGYIPKTLSNDVLLPALRLVLSGGTFVPQEILRPAWKAPAWPGGAGGGMRNASGRRPLTPRQKEVLQLIANGKRNKQIARELGLAVCTVKLHVTALMKALDADNRTDAVVKAARLGLLTDESCPT